MFNSNISNHHNNKRLADKVVNYDPVQNGEKEEENVMAIMVGSAIT